MSYKELKKAEEAYKAKVSIEKKTTLIELNVTGYGFSIRISFADLIHNLNTNMLYSLLRDIKEELSQRNVIQK